MIDVVVVGAGLAGLAAARRLHEAGLEVQVLEASDQVGGRTVAAEVAGAIVDLGGTFVGPTQTRAIALADELGLVRHDTHDTGDSLIRWRSKLRRFQGTIPSISPAALIDLGRVRLQFERLARTVPPGRPWDAPKAARLDETSLGQWLERIRASRATRDLMAVVTRVSWGCEPGELSLLHALHYVNQAGGLDSMLDTAGGAQEQHFVGGSQQLCLKMAADLGDRVRLSSPVMRLEWTADGVVAHSPSGATAARRAVVAVPPASRPRVGFVPPLPHDQRVMSQRWSPGVLSKAYAVYERPFWREDGLSGEGLSDTGPCFITFDASPPDGSRGVLLGFIGGTYAREWDVLTDEERRQRALASFADLFGPAALEPIGYRDQRWATEEWIGGGPVAAPGPGAVLDYHRSLTEPVGPIHWAGSETAERWAGFMDGAISSGERAAAEVLSTLGTP
ncbi:flavin monoamine oxidase family protein [Nocardioides sp.]|uniref:flavin monoamine oxidase family protein n=1 Tax=Nocardioides sp. TaxID=35761 RepID=UPI0035616DBD